MQNESNDQPSPIPNTNDAVQDELIAVLYRRLGCMRKVATALSMSRKAINVVLVRLGLLAPSGRTTSQSKRSAYLRELREDRRMRGLCYRCGEPAKPGYTVCERHREVQRAASRRKQGERAKQNLCADCNSPRLPQCSRCQKCLDRYRQLNTLKTKIRREKGLCGICGKPNDSDKMNCEDCRSRLYSRTKQTRQQRADAGLCSGCGETPELVPGKAVCLLCHMKERSVSIFGTIAEAQALLDLWEAQNGVCPYTGLQLTLGVDAHLDHIVPLSKRGANAVGNLQWVHKDVNEMKAHFTEEEFLRLVGLIAKRRLAN